MKVALFSTGQLTNAGVLKEQQAPPELAQVAAAVYRCGSWQTDGDRLKALQAHAQRQRFICLTKS
jgi:hypothetical protein